MREHEQFDHLWQRVAADHLHRTALITAYRPREHCASYDQSQDLASGSDTLSC